MPELNLASIISRLERQPRYWLAPALALALLALFFLSAGIDQLDMRPNPIYLPEPQFEVEQDGGGSLTLISAEVMERILIILMMICMPILVLSSLFVLVNSQARKTVIKDFLTKLAYIFPLFLLIMTAVSIFTQDYQEILGDAYRGPNMPRWSAAEQMPPWMGFAVALFVLLGLFLVGWYIWLRLRPESKASSVDATLERLSLEVQASLEELRMGGDLRNVIMRCYYDMANIIEEKRGAEREQWMTPREFEGRLVSLGLPRQPVVDLTRLFEQVRYGAAQPSRKEEHLAVQSLTAIVDAIGGRA